jgi:hypothetical protein
MCFDLKLRWRTYGSEANCKRMAFLWYFCSLGTFKSVNNFGSLEERVVEAEVHGGDECVVHFSRVVDEW